ncbi:MAG: chorismate-binding protein [Candidatus Taylorbacteria bacterium]
MKTSRKLFGAAFEQSKTEGRQLVTLIHSTKLVEPLVVYRKICEQINETVCIMESATHTGEKGRFSYVCVRGSELLKIEKEEDLTVLKNMLQKYSPQAHPTLPFIGGAVGYLGHDLITLVEKTIVPHEHDPFQLPLGAQYFFTDVIVFDHTQREMHYVANVSISDGKTADVAYEDGLARISEMERLVANEVIMQKTPPHIGPISSNVSRAEYHEMVLKAKEHIVAGNVMQVVLSQRFQASYDLGQSEGWGLPIYEKLRELNPSPYMFHMRFGAQMNHLTLLGASPEIMVHIAHERMRIRPIAGTRKRGKNAEEDKQLAEELLNDPKEIAEHVMLLDLARHDVSRFCKDHSVQITSRMKVESYSHVMHIVSEVEGVLRDKVHPLDACIGSLPAGTLSGAPKIRALRIIVELEKSRRGPYGGAFGWMTNVATDTCIFIRSAMLYKGVIYWQSGGGIVNDSEPESEYQETLAKAKPMETVLGKLGKLGTH